MSNIQCKQGNKYYGNNHILKDISLEITSNKITGLIGKSGSGKSTLLLCLSSLIKFDSGLVNLNGKKTGIVFQDYALWPHLSVLENLILAPMKVLKLNKTQASEKATELLKHFNIGDKIDNYPNQLSGGQKQKVALIRCLLMNPEIILFDEPTAALDPVSIQGLVNIIQELKQQNVTLVIATHDVSFIKNVADNIIYLEEGVVKEQGNIDILNTPKTEALNHYMQTIIA